VGDTPAGSRRRWRGRRSRRAAAPSDLNLVFITPTTRADKLRPTAERWPRRGLDSVRRQHDLDQAIAAPPHASARAIFTSARSFTACATTAAARRHEHVTLAEVLKRGGWQTGASSGRSCSVEVGARQRLRHYADDFDLK
jgi:hypothetical protein